MALLMDPWAVKAQARFPQARLIGPVAVKRAVREHLF